MWFDWIKGYYDRGFTGYDDQGIKVFVKAGYITSSEYRQITNIDYVA